MKNHKDTKKTPDKSGKMDELKSLPMQDLFKKLDSSEKGISPEEAKKRLTQYGPNEIKEEIANLFLKFLSYFCGQFHG